MCIFTNDIKHTSLTTYAKWGNKTRTLIYNIIQSIYMSVYQKPPHFLFIEHCGNTSNMNVYLGIRGIENFYEVYTANYSKFSPEQCMFSKKNIYIETPPSLT